MSRNKKSANPVDTFYRSANCRFNASSNKPIRLTCIFKETIAGNPFTIATVIRGTGVNSDKPNDENDEVHRAMEGLGKPALGILGRLYGGVVDTYRSWSSRKQIEDSQFVGVINDACSFFSLPKLS